MTPGLVQWVIFLEYSCSEMLAGESEADEDGEDIGGSDKNVGEENGAGIWECCGPSPGPIPPPQPRCLGRRGPAALLNPKPLELCLSGC